MITWRHPEWFLLLIPWAILCFAFCLSQIKSLSWLKGKISKRFLPNFTSYQSKTSVWLHCFVYFLMGSFLILALVNPERPQETEIEEPIPHLHFVLDASYSMLVRDTAQAVKSTLDPPNRLNVAKNQILEILERFPNSYVSLQTFSGTSSTVFAPMRNHELLKESLPRIATHLLKHTGSDFERPLKDLFESPFVSLTGPRAVVFLSDGEPKPEKPISENISKKLKSFEIPVFSILIGTKQGSLLQLYDPQDVFERKQKPRIAKTITTKMNPKILKELSKATGGKAYVMNSRFSLKNVTHDLSESFHKHNRQANSETIVLKESQAHYLAALFLLLFCFEIFLMSKKKKAALQLLIPCLLLLLSSCDLAPLRAHHANEVGIVKYRVNRHKGAQTEFYLSSQYRYREEIPYFNLGNSFTLEERFAEAHKTYQKTIQHDPSQADFYFNDGVALYFWAESEWDPKGCFKERSQTLLEQSLKRFEDAQKHGKNSQRNIAHIQKRLQELQDLEPQDCPTPPPPPPSSQDQDPNDGGKSQDKSSSEEKQSFQQELQRIKKESQEIKGFHPGDSQQLPKDPKELDKEILW